MAKLTIKRHNDPFLKLLTWYVFIDGSKHGSLSTDEEKVLELQPGRHDLQVRAYNFARFIPGVAQYYYSQPVSVDVGTEESIELTAAPHPLWNFTHQPKLFSNTESLILLPSGEKHKQTIAAFNSQRRKVTAYLDTLYIPNTTWVLTATTATVLIVSNILAISAFKEREAWALLAGVLSLTGLFSGKVNKWMLASGFEWKHQLTFALLILLVTGFKMADNGYAALKVLYLLLAAMHLGVALLAHKKQPVLPGN